MSVTVAALEWPHAFGRVDEALAHADALLGTLRGVALAAFAECALTGYVSERGSFDLSPFAEPVDGPTVARLSALARKHGLALAAPLVEREGARLFNALVIFAADGSLAGRYRKRHPWYPETWATPGDLGTPLVEVAGLRVAPAICFDFHFVGDDAPDALAAADLLLAPSAWVSDEPADTRLPLLAGLASRFGCAVLGPNWGVGRPLVPGQGGSLVLGPDGAVRARATGRGPQAIVAAVERRR